MHHNVLYFKGNIKVFMGQTQPLVFLIFLQIIHKYLGRS